jgi:toxin-antitoxin system PIN domain toxin
MLVDANVLLFAVLKRSPFFQSASRWLDEVLRGPTRVGLPWLSLGAFVRIVTNPRAIDAPPSPQDAWSVVEAWLERPNVWIPNPTERHAEVLGDLVRRHHLAGNLITDAQLAALAVEHGLAIYSADTDFARFREVSWINPLA